MQKLLSKKTLRENAYFKHQFDIIDSVTIIFLQFYWTFVSLVSREFVTNFFREKELIRLTVRSCDDRENTKLKRKIIWNCRVLKLRSDAENNHRMYLMLTAMSFSLMIRVFNDKLKFHDWNPLHRWIYYLFLLLKNMRYFKFRLIAESHSSNWFCQFSCLIRKYSSYQNVLVSDTRDM